MKLFTCTSCNQVVFFENVACTNCGHALAYLQDLAVLSALDVVHDVPGAFVALAPEAKGARYRLCANYTQYAVCNWAIPEASAATYCTSCALNDTIPNMADNHAHEAWHRLEKAKRRLVYTLIGLGLPLEPKRVSPRGLAFSFLEENPSAKVLTGHDDGLITINIAEADDPFREKMRVQLGEAYRTVLGHFRHEIGHYYWERLLAGSVDIPKYRELFGDETLDYQAAMQRHYQQGAPPDWPMRFVSAYASMHPWEDWAETWAHYLHMIDTLDTALSFGLSAANVELEMELFGRDALYWPDAADADQFLAIVNDWTRLTGVLNEMSRSMGQPDFYPFVLPRDVVGKLQFIHAVVQRAAKANLISN